MDSAEWEVSVARMAACSGSRREALMCEGRMVVVPGARMGGSEGGGFESESHWSRSALNLRFKC